MPIKKPSSASGRNKPGRRPAPRNTAPIEVTEAIGYVRVSTGEQAESGLSLEAQRERITAQAAANGWRLVDVLEDAGVSAKTMDRPGLQAALKALRPGRVLLALKLDRLTRSVRDLYDLTTRISDAGAEWACVQEKFDTTTATGRLILAIMVQLSQWERETTSERTVAALGQKRTRGERLGTTPLGYTTIVEGDTTRVEVDEEEAETVRLARELRGHGLSFRRIAAMLRDMGRKTKRGGAWEAATVARLVKPRYLESCLE